MGGLTVFISVIFTLVFLATSGLSETADGFFAAVRENDMKRARTYLSEDFNAKTTDTALMEYLAANALTDVRETSWGERSRNGGRGALIGSVTTGNGGVAPVSLSFVKGATGWKIYAIAKPSAGLQEESGALDAPSEAAQVKLISETMHVFAVAVNNRSMAKFHDYLAYSWQQEITPEYLNNAFEAFYDAGLDLTVLDSIGPKFDELGTVDEDGLIWIKGHYKTKPNRVFFEQTYAYEGLGWKLVGFRVKIKADE